MNVDWEQLALSVGGVGNDVTEVSSDELAAEAICELIGEESLRKAVDHYIFSAPGYVLAHSLLSFLRPKVAMDYCYEIYQSERDISERRFAVILLRAVADHRAVSWVNEFMSDEDEMIQSCGIGVLEQLILSGFVDEHEALGVLETAEKHKNADVRETIASIRNFLGEKEERS